MVLAHAISLNWSFSYRLAELDIFIFPFTFWFLLLIIFLAVLWYFSSTNIADLAVVYSVTKILFCVSIDQLWEMSGCFLLLGTCQTWICLYKLFRNCRTLMVASMSVTQNMVEIVNGSMHSNVKVIRFKLGLTHIY